MNTIVILDALAFLGLDAFAIYDIGNDKIFQQSRFAHAGFTNDIHMAAAVVSFDAKTPRLIAEIRLAEYCYVATSHTIGKLGGGAAFFLAGASSAINGGAAGAAMVGCSGIRSGDSCT